MKKKILSIFMLLTLVLVTGCGEKKEELAPFEVLTKTVEKLNEYNSYEVAATMKMAFKQNGANVSFEVPYSVSMQQTDSYVGVKLFMGESDLIPETEAYIEASIEGGKELKNLTAYLPANLLEEYLGTELEEGKFYYYSMDLADVTADIPEETSKELEQALEKIQNLDYKKIIGDNFVYVDTTDEIRHYQLVFNMDLVKRLFVELGEEVTDDMNIDFELKLDLYIDKDYNVVRESIDLKDILNESIAGEEDAPVFDEVSLTFENKNINNTTVTVPETIKNSALDLNKVIEEQQKVLEQMSSCFAAGGYWENDKCVNPEM